MYITKIYFYCQDVFARKIDQRVAFKHTFLGYLCPKLE